MPVDSEIKQLPKQWLVDVATGLLGEKFTDWVLAQVAEHDRGIRQKGDLEVEMDPEVYEAFMASNAVSSKSSLVHGDLTPLTDHFIFVDTEQRGVAAQMLKVGTKRRRTPAQVEADDEREAIEAEERQDRRQQLTDLEALVKEQQRYRAQYLAREAQLAQFGRDKVIHFKADGSLGAGEAPYHY